MPYIFSTLTSSVRYVKYTAGGGDLPVPERSVLIEGGSNIPDKRLVTPQGVMTVVGDEDFSWLKDDELFKLHMKNGFIRVENKTADPEVVAADMERRDQSAPLVEADFKEDEAPVFKDDDDDSRPAGGKGRRRG